MKLEDVLKKEKVCEIPDRIVLGIDIGSRQAKAVLLLAQKIYTALIPTGFVMQESADELIEILLEQSGLKKESIDYIVVTGYGRVALHFDFAPCRLVTEIACHGKGAYFLGDGVRTIIDIGGQDSKAIKINPDNGNVVNFAMNDKCAAGTGRFLEKIANVLEFDATEIGKKALDADEVIKIDSTCVVFAESEVVSARAKGIRPENIAAGIHYSIAKRVSGLLNRVGIDSNVLFTGGVSNNVGMRKAFEDILDIKIVDSKLDTVFAGALGAAVYAAEFAQRNLPSFEGIQTEVQKKQVNLSNLITAVEKHKENFINKTAGKSAYVAYTCVYTPIEILAAADVSFIRLLHKGSQDELISGETITQSMCCDFVKGLIGSFMKGEPLYRSVEKIYSFYTCPCMKSALGALNELYVPTVVYQLPRKKNDEEQIPYLTDEMREFKKDLEELTGKRISEEKIVYYAEKYNEARAIISRIAEYRKVQNPLISASEFQLITKAYFSLPIEEYLILLKDIECQLKCIPNNETSKIRLMLSGGVLAEEDKKITSILESLGVTIVVEDNCSGIKPISFCIDINSDDIYSSLARAYVGKAPCSRMEKKADMLENTKRLANEYNVDGVVLYYLKFCSSYSVIEKLYRERFPEEETPIITISGDYAQGDEGQIKTRLEAFVELLRQRKGL